MNFTPSCIRTFGLIAALTLSPIAAHAIAILSDDLVLSEDSEVTVTFEGYSASYTSHLFFVTPEGSFDLFTNKTATVGDSKSLVGTFAAGTKLVFGLFVETTGKTFYTGLSSLNLDGVAHATTETNGSTALVGFEDLWGGGDRDYNDFKFSVTAQPVPDAASTGLLMALGLAGLALARRRLS